MHVAFTTDDEGARPASRWALRHLLTCRGWFFQDDCPLSGPHITIHYGNISNRHRPANAGPLLCIDRLPIESDEPPARPGDARSSDGRELLVSYPGVSSGTHSGEQTLWTREDGTPLATITDFSGNPANATVRLHADVLQPALFLLARMEERDGARDSLGRFVPGGSWLAKHDLLEKPVVDEIGWLLHDLLRTLLTRAGTWSAYREPWPGARSHAIAITHDQDQAIRWERRMGRHMLGVLKGPNRGSQSSLLLRDLREGAVPPTLLTERLLRWERERSLNATYFFLTVPRDRFGRRYDISSPPFRKVLGILRDQGHSVGLHGSLRTYRDQEVFRNERSRIGNVLGTEPAGVRQHYLRVQLPETWSCQQQAGFQYDASLGYPDDPGFRAGTSYPLFPDGLESFLAFPLTGMDRALHGRGLTTPEAWSEWAAETRLAEGLVDVLWHPYFVDTDFGLDREVATIALLDWAASSGAWVAGLDSVDAWWRARDDFRVVKTEEIAGSERVTFRAGADVQDLALTLAGAVSDIRIARADGIEARWTGARLLLDAEAGGTMTLSRKTR